LAGRPSARAVAAGGALPREPVGSLGLGIEQTAFVHDESEARRVSVPGADHARVR